MRRKLRNWLGAIGFAMLSAWSAAGFAQSVSCSGTICSYGPICPDAWGGCYFYTWSIGSAINKLEEKAGFANVINLCDPKNPTPETCINFKSEVGLNTEDGGYNTLIFCKVPGAETCKGKQCGGSPDSGGAVFLNLQFSTSISNTLQGSDCSKDDKDKGGIKCSKTNTLTGPENNPELSAQFCANPKWIISKWWPLNFTGTTTFTGPVDRKGTQASEVATARCWLKDPAGNMPYELGYAPSAVLSENTLCCGEKSICELP